MAKYLLIASRDPFETNEAVHCYELARELRRDGNEVTVFLVQNGVFPARDCIHSTRLTDLAQAGVEVLADKFSLQERGIAPAGLVPGVTPSALEIVIDHLADGFKTVWH
ncbi:MAG: DsrE family protein [Sphingomonadales bacterium]